MGNFGTKKEKPVEKKGFNCAGCEKEVETEEELKPYIGKMYCSVCIASIKGNNRRTMGSIQRTASTNADEPQVHVEIQSNPKTPSPKARRSYEADK
eukprot:TRINITY_DN1090_c0_g1_i1.p1 TRINITY_DN1090_c0_g1~~TRINITY_DN1090_c0_g1_i1.p1  ORF type:complete len:110 (+),score=28.55 TRINITY_DN1090_c0_g1_i1:45-332(+)